ncbi:MAG: hypothetical protein EA408_02890 [Marinilabiliales bacterium]|nr:MAG: hypothetical protein EA408_02890 [Marinilabiliales bacterium]
MNSSAIKKQVLTLIILAGLAATSYGTQEAVRKYEKLFPLTDRASLEISNRYGSIDIRNWDREEISVEVLVKVTHASQETADRQLSHISVNFTQVNNSVSAVTTIDQRISRPGSRWFSSGEDGPGITIDYIVYAPRETDLKISHRYGDVFVNEATGHTLIELWYGNLQANKIIRDNTRPLSEITLAYSPKATINEAQWLKVNMRYSDLTVETCRALVVSSRYSKLRVESASSIVSEANYSEYILGRINNFVSEGAYTNYSINTLLNSLDVESRYGNVRVDNVPPGFSKVRFVGSYGNMRMGLDERASYKIESSASYGTVTIPQSERVNRISRGQQSTLSGKVGDDPSPSAVIEINTRYGNVNLNPRR